jgi:PTS system mannose-specific IIC component
LPSPGIFAVAIGTGIAAAWIGSISMVRHRQLIAAFAKTRLARISAGERAAMLELQLFGLTADLLRGALLGVVTFVPGAMLSVYVRDEWTLSDPLTRAAIVTLVAAVAAASVWKDFHAIKGTRRLFLVSLAAGTFLVMARG